VCGDTAYEVEVDCDAGVTDVLLLFYSENLFAGLGFADSRMIEYRKGDITTCPKPTQIGRHYFLSLRPSLMAAGTGEVRFRNFTYKALP
jgi:hypothetical protein